MVNGIVFFFQGLIASVVFYGNGIRKLVIGEKLAVSVIDISPGAFQFPFFFNLKGKIAQILLTVYNLKHKHPLQQDPKQRQNGNGKHK